MAAQQGTRHDRPALIEHREQRIRIAGKAQAALQEQDRRFTDMENLILHGKEACPAPVRAVEDLRRARRARAQHAEDIRLLMHPLREPRRLEERRAFARVAPDALQPVLFQDGLHLLCRKAMVQQDGAHTHGLQREKSRELVDKRIGRHEDIAADTERHGHGRHARDAPPELRIGERALIHDQGPLLRPALRLPIDQRRIVAQIGLLVRIRSLFHYVLYLSASFAHASPPYLSLPVHPAQQRSSRIASPMPPAPAMDRSPKPPPACRRDCNKCRARTAPDAPYGWP